MEQASKSLAEGRREAVLARLVTALFSLIQRVPRWMIDAFAKVMTPLVLLVARKERHQLFENIDRIHRLPPHSSFSRAFARQVTSHQVRAILETYRSIYRPKDLEVEGMDELRKEAGRLLEQGKGMMIVTAHLGSWELVGRFVAEATSRPFYVLAKPSRFPGVTQIMESFRSRMGTEVLWTDKKSLPRDMLGALKNGHSLGFVMDQKPKGRVGYDCQFFDHTTAFVSGPAQMAVKTKCPILAVFCLREGPWRYRIETELVLDAHHDADNPEALTQRMATIIENQIKLYPEQWTWNYRRWKWRPA